MKKGTEPSRKLTIGPATTRIITAPNVGCRIALEVPWTS